MRSSGLAALLVTVASAGSHHELHHELHQAHLHPRDSLNIEPSGVCPAFPTITAQLQPVAYNEFFPYTTVIFPFRNGVPFTVSNAPTVVRITSTLTYLITPSTVATTSTPSTVPNPSTVPTTSAPGASNPTTGLAIGQGLPTGSMGNLADEMFIFLAYSSDPRVTPVIARRQENARHLEASATRPIDAINLAQPTSLLLSGLSQDSCDSASPFLLRQGRLVQYTIAVGKAVFEIAPLLGLPLSPPTDQANETFSLNNGVLQWITADFNEDATFYDCGGLLYAAFNTIPSLDCIPVIIGAIAGSVCINHVQQTRAANPTFVAPIAAITSSPTTVPMPSTSPSSSTSTSIISGSTSIAMSSSASNPSASCLTGTSTSTSDSLNSDLTTSTIVIVSPSASPQPSSSTGLSSLQVSSSKTSSTGSISRRSSHSSSPSSSTGIAASSSSSQSSTTVAATSGTATTADSSTTTTTPDASTTTATISPDTSTTAASGTATTTDTSPTTTTTTTNTPDTSTITTITTADTTPTTTTTTAATTSRGPPCSDIPNPYTAQNGKHYLVQCDRSFVPADIITAPQTPDFVTCMNLCSVTPGCQYLNFNSFSNNICTLSIDVYRSFANPGGQIAYFWPFDD